MSGLPPVETTLFNFEPVLDHVRATSDSIASNYVTVDRFNQVLVEIAKQTIVFEQNGQAIQALNVTVSNFTTLLEALIQALNGVATLNLQQQEIALLQQLTQPVAERGSFNADKATIT